MTKIAKLAMGVALAFACAGVHAGLHQICYEGPAVLADLDGDGVLEWVSTGIFGCSLDQPGSCTITPQTSRFRTRASNSPLDQGVQPGLGTFRFFNFIGSDTLTSESARVEFFDATGAKIAERVCTVNPMLFYQGDRYGPSDGAVLTGFSTDASGLATTGVWKLQSGTVAGSGSATVRVPGDFVSVGGGAQGVETPNGAMVAGSTKWGQRGWFARTSEGGGAPQPHQTTAFAIGLRIEGLSARDLSVLMLKRAQATTHPNFVNHPSTQVQTASNTEIVIGGGADSYADQANSSTLFGQFGTVSAPLYGQTLVCSPSGICRAIWDVVGWRGESKDHVIAHPGWINVEVLSLPSTIQVGGSTFQVQKRVVAATSAVAAHPATDVTGLRGEFALTGIGATVDWQRFDSAGNQIAAGNLLWKLEPRADIGGASVGAKDHVISSPASVTAHAIGIKLVLKPVTLCPISGC